MRRAGALSTLALALAACDPSLSGEPFLCAASGACPDGFSCRSGVCVAEGAAPSSARVSRVEWINAGEMFWVDRGVDGATLVVNDGFTGGAQGIYRIDVAADGSVSDPVVVVPYEDPFPRSSGVALLDDGRLGVALLRFPDATGTDLSFSVQAIDLDSGTAEVLFEETEPYLGGFEPAYVTLVAGVKSIDAAWVRASQGGRVEVVHLTRQGSTYAAETAEAPLPASVLPLSGDALLFPLGDGSLGLRVGFESFAVAKVDVSSGTPVLQPFVELDAIPVWADSSRLTTLIYGDETEGGYELGVGTMGWDGTSIGETPVGEIGSDAEPFVGAPGAGGVLLAPMPGDDPRAVVVGEVGPDGTYAAVASVERAGDNSFYGARVLEKDGKLYVAWTEFQGSLMDLWVAVTERSP